MVAEYHKPVISLGKIAQVASGMMGKPYLLGGSGPEGFDCITMVYHFYHSLGIRLPIEFEGIHFSEYRSHILDFALFARFLHSLGEPVHKNHILPGDLAIIEPVGKEETHPAILLTNSHLLLGSIDLGIIQVPLRVILSPISFRRILCLS